MSSSRRGPVFLLGAGFSRAISPEMPVLTELGAEIAARFASTPRLRRMLSARDLKSVTAGRVPLGNLELWLSSLAAEQPFLSRPRNLERRALFMELAVQIAEVIDVRSLRATQRPVPDWLLRLLVIWHHSRSEVLTFNYDLLVESALLASGIRSGAGAGVVRPSDITGELPPEFPEKGFLGKDQHETFTLRKLHGSTNWYGRTSSSDLFSIFRIDELVPAWGDRSPALRPVLQALVQGSERMLLPPVADKTTSYTNPTTGALWRAAHATLQEASEVVIFGYSVPATDASVLALLDDAIARHIPVTVVDLSPESVVETLARVGITNVEGVTPPGTTAFDGLLVRLERQLSKSLDRSVFTGLNRRCFIEAVTPDRRHWPVVNATKNVDGHLTLEVATEPTVPGVAMVHVSPTHLAPSVARRVRSILFPGGLQSFPLRAYLLQNTSEHSQVSIDVSMPA